MSFLSKFLGTSSSATNSDDPKSVRVILEKLHPLSDEKARELACFSYVLGRVANADSEITPEEVQSIRSLLEDRGGLSFGQAELVAELALSEARQMGGTQDYLVTRQLQSLASRERRLEMLDCLIAVAAADGVIVPSEEDELKQIARQLGFQTPVFLEALAKYRSYRSVLKGMG